MALIDLQRALRSAGLDAEIAGDHVVFPYKVPVGDHVGTTVKIGLTGADFPINPPGGVHISPGLTHPGGNNNASAIGAGWMYWSRPYPDWASSGRGIEDYLAFLRQLFAQFTSATV
jgi:hypothetical protein